MKIKPSAPGRLLSERDVDDDGEPLFRFGDGDGDLPV
jgi:hypothetical protein